MKLTEIERTTLANQYKILSILDPQEKRSHLEKALILENGIESLYAETLLSDDDAVDPATAKETGDILDMFTYINNSISSFNTQDTIEIQKQIEAIKFNGFNGNRDKHYSMMIFFVEKFGRFKEYKNTEYNSHSSSSLNRYRKILSVHLKLREGKNRYSKEDIITLYNAI